MATTAYRCTNFGGCNKALERETIEIEDGEEPICPEPGCGKKLEPLGGGPPPPPPWGLIACIGAVLVLGLAAYLLISKGKKQASQRNDTHHMPASSCDDRQLAVYLRDRFAADEFLKDDAIQIDVANKIVVLSGSVANDSDRAHAEDIVHYSNCQVVSLVNQLSTTPSDQALTDDIRKLLAADPELRDQPINVAVSHGVVVLSGSVASRVMRTNAGPRLSSVHGVKNVINNLDVVPPQQQLQPQPPPPPPSDQALSDDIRKLLAADPELRDQSINDAVSHGVVVLSGSVASSVIRTNAGSRISSVHGVKNVINNLGVVTPTRPTLTGAWTGTYQSCAQATVPIRVQIKDQGTDDITAAFRIDVPGEAAGTFIAHGVLMSINGYLSLQFSGWEHQPVGVSMGNIGGYVVFTRDAASSFSGIIKAPGCGQIALKKGS